MRSENPSITSVAHASKRVSWPVPKLERQISRTDGRSAPRILEHLAMTAGIVVLIAAIIAIRAWIWWPHGLH